jgi:hypothetical protein
MTTTATTAKPITKIVEITLNGFHGYQSHNVRATFTPTKRYNSWGDEIGDGYDVTITESAARKFSCRGECTCGEGVPTEFECDEYDFEHGDITLNGNYPQR